MLHVKGEISLKNVDGKERKEQFGEHKTLREGKEREGNKWQIEKDLFFFVNVLSTKAEALEIISESLGRFER